MPKKPLEATFADLAAFWMDVQDAFARRGLYVEVMLLLVTSTRKPAILNDVALELIVRRRAGGAALWRGTESLRWPGRQRMRSIAGALIGLIGRAVYDIREAYPLPGEDAG